jgi:hypothetical protein
MPGRRLNDKSHFRAYPIRHEAARAGRLAYFWETAIDDPLMRGARVRRLAHPPD